MISFLTLVRLYPIIQEGHEPYVMFEHISKYPGCIRYELSSAMTNSTT
jgi:hypothetical protein